MKKLVRKERTVKFLFFDYWTLEYVRNFENRMHQPAKYEGNPILGPERSYEYTRVHMFGTVMRDQRDGNFRMWYTTHSGKGGAYDPSNLCYAVSKDGFDWQRPDLDVVPGSNIVIDESYYPHGPTILYDPEDSTEERRYKCLMRPMNFPAIFAYVSPDGIHWRKAQEEPVLQYNSDCHVGLFRHPGDLRYYASYRTDCPDRRVWISESDDFIHWKSPVLSLEPDIRDPVQTQIYGMQMSPYGSCVMGWISMFNTVESDMGFSKMQGTMDVQLAFSREGYGWHRIGQGKRFIPHGGEGTWDAQIIIPSSDPVLLEDEIRFYYSGTQCGHAGPYDTQDECIGAASLRPDGFVSLHAGEDLAELQTRQFALNEPEVRVNAACLQGYLKLEICSAAGEPIEGFSFDDCRPIQGDGIDLPVRWKGSGSAIVGKPIRLRLRTKRADLYSIWMPNGDPAPEYRRFREISCLDPDKEILR